MILDEDYMRFNMLDDVTHQDLGWWITKAGDTEMQYELNVVQLALTLGWDGIDPQVMAEEAPYLMSDEADIQDIEDFGFVCEDAVAWMNDKLEATDFGFTHYSDGLRLETVRFIDGGSPIGSRGGRTHDFALDA